MPVEIVAAILDVPAERVTTWQAWHCYRLNRVEIEAFILRSTPIGEIRLIDAGLGDTAVITAHPDTLAGMISRNVAAAYRPEGVP